MIRYPIMRNLQKALSVHRACQRVSIDIDNWGQSTVFFNSENRQIPLLRKRHPDPLVEIHPETAENLGIKDGEWVWIETARGRIRQKAKLTCGINPRVVHVEHAWWYPEKPGPEYGVWESSAIF